MSSRPLISCVMLTTHPRRASYVADALRSFRAQSWPRRELVVVNDGPVRLAPSAPDVRVVNLPPEHPEGRRWTLGEKRNVGVQTAEGEWLATWDDDDLSLPDRLEAQITFALMFGADHVMADRAHVADSELRVFGACFRGVARPVMASALIRRSALVAAGGYPAKDYCEDAELLARMRHIGRANCAVMVAPWYVLRRHRDNITNGFGESADAWITCALRDPVRDDAQARVDAVRRGDGANDLQELLT